MATEPADGQQTPARARIGDVFRLVMAGAEASDAAVRLWLLYRAHHIDGRGAYISDPEAAARLGWGARKVQRARAELLKMEALIRVLRGPNPPSYYPQPFTQDSPVMATQDSPSSASQRGKGSPQGSPSVSPVCKEETILSRKDGRDTPEGSLPPPVTEAAAPKESGVRTTDAQALTNHVMDVGMQGARFADYGKQCARSAQLLAKGHNLADLTAAADQLALQWPYCEGRTFDVFTVGFHVEKILAELRASVPPPPEDTGRAAVLARRARLVQIRDQRP